MLITTVFRFVTRVLFSCQINCKNYFLIYTLPAITNGDHNIYIILFIYILFNPFFIFNFYDLNFINFEVSIWI